MPNHLTFFLFGLLVFSSCIMDEKANCEGIVDIHFSLIDTAYFNEPKTNEKVVFSDFINELDYAMFYDKQLIRKGHPNTDANVNGNKKNFDLSFSDILPGHYTIAAWCNIEKDYPQGDLHAANKANRDIFVGLGFVEATYPRTDKTVFLHRIKGKLRVYCDNFPQQVSKIKMNVTNIYHTVDSKLFYSGESSLAVESRRANSFETLLAPTVANKQSIVEFEFSSDNSILSSITNIPVLIKRNEVTELRITYTEKNWQVDLWLNDKWEAVENLTINNPLFQVTE